MNKHRVYQIVTFTAIILAFATLAVAFILSDVWDLAAVVFSFLAVVTVAAGALHDPTHGG